MTKQIARFLSVLFFLSISCLGWAGAAEQSESLSAKYSTEEALGFVDVLEIATLNIEKAIAEDLEKKNSTADKGPFRVGIASQLEINTGSPVSFSGPVTVGQSRGTWEKVEPELYLWRLKVRSSEGKWLSFGFTQYHLPDGATLSVRSLDNQWVAGPFSEKNNSVGGQLWTPAILGAEAVIELIIKESKIGELKLLLGSVTEGYRMNFDSSSDLEKSGSCNVDVICPEGDAFRNQIRSVGRYSFTEYGGSYVCTGSLINNTRNDGTPYFLTANHCVDNNSTAATVVVYWEYESAVCRPPGSIESGTSLPRPAKTQSGSILVATSAASDFALLQLYSMPQYDVFWSGWDRTGANPASAVCIHHPRGHEKRISHEYNPVTTTSYLSSSYGDGTHFRIADWDSGTTEGGSSGSGLWDTAGRIVGQLHGGYADCTNNEPDWYGRLAASWTGGGTPSSRLSDWLDPIGSGATVLDGYPSGTSPNTMTMFPSIIMLLLDNNAD